MNFSMNTCPVMSLLGRDGLTGGMRAMGLTEVFHLSICISQMRKLYKTQSKQSMLGGERERAVGLRTLVPESWV